MKKYIIIVLLPILFQGYIYCSNLHADLNKAIQTSLISARRAMNNEKIPLELERILAALIADVATGKINKAVAIDRIKAIKDDLERYESEQYTMWSRWFGLNSEIVKDQINPAILQVNAVLKALNAELINYNYEIAGTILGLGLASFIGAWVIYANFLANNPARTQARTAALANVPAFAMPLFSSPTSDYNSDVFSAKKLGAAAAELFQRLHGKGAAVRSDEKSYPPFTGFNIRKAVASEKDLNHFELR